MKKRKRHNYRWDKERVKFYDDKSIIKKMFLDDEYCNSVPEEPRKVKTTNFYDNYAIKLPIEPMET